MALHMLLALLVMLSVAVADTAAAATELGTRGG